MLNRKIIVPVFILLLIFLAGAYFEFQKEQNIGNTGNIPNIEGGNVFSRVLIGETSVNVSVAKTFAEQTLGLSGRSELSDNEGMLFVFDKPNFHRIWMKEMKFSIDILSIDENLKIVDVKTDANPESFPEIFEPRKKSSFVLELPSGFFKKHSLKIGDKLSFVAVDP